VFASKEIRMNVIAELRNVTKAFDTVTALEDINLQIYEGEILALVGSNGSGKTTLLKLLAFIERPTKGEIILDGISASEKNLEQLRLQSTMVFQRTVLFSTTVYDNVAYGLRIRKIPKRDLDERVKDALRLVRLEGFERRHAKKLSGGEQQRVALARALAMRTRLLLLDEPTANLDPKSASLVEEIIAAANRESRITVVMATHNMFQAKSLPHRVALIASGKVSEIETPAEMFGRLSKSLAGFVVLENTFNGIAKTTQAGTTMIDIGGGIQLESTIQNEGNVSVFVSPRDIILSKTEFASSARNILKGRITEIIDSDSLVRLKVDVGKPFLAQITKRSFNEMSLNLNAEIYLAFKASSVQAV